MFNELQIEINFSPISLAGKLQIISDLLNGWYDENGEFVPPFISKEEAQELLNLDLQSQNMEHR